MSAIEQIAIFGIHHSRDVVLPFRNKHCIMIGPNGSGKSTALQIIAHTLGRQWKIASTLRFDRIEISFQSGAVAILERADCELFSKTALGQFGRVRESWAFADQAFSNQLSFVNFDNEVEVQSAARQLGTTPTALRVMQKRVFSDPGAKRASNALREFIAVLDAEKTPANLYLPTYRRIELELKKILDDIPENYRRVIDERQRKTISSEFMTEVVRFGMEDVADRLSAFERDTRDFSRNRFNRMMTSYLKDMAGTKAMSTRELKTIPLTQDSISQTLSRIEEGLLSENEKADISSTVLELAHGKIKGNPTFAKMWLAHFFIKLYQVNKEIQERESSMLLLVSSINKYLAPKSLAYDIESYHAGIVDSDGTELALSDLSSGEKQVMSILSEVYFRTSPFNMLIDEPELSLSVPWQLDLLDDIDRAPTCGQIIAVTHSPFIYDNRFSNSVVDFSRA